MMNLQAPTHQFESLRTFMDQIEKHLRSLEVLGENVNQNSGCANDYIQASFENTKTTRIT